MIAQRLIAAGRDAATPVALVENASQAGERRALATLATLPEVAAGFDGPVILIIGEVAALASTSAHPGEGRDPDQRVMSFDPLSALNPARPAPYDLGPGLRRDERVLGAGG